MKAGGFGPVGAFVATTLVTIGITVGTTYYQKELADKAEARNNERLAKQEARAKIMNLKEHNRTLNQINSGYLIAKENLIDEKRQRSASLRNYGVPV